MQDLRLAVRSLCSTPIVTFVAVLSLALGIGANTAIFSLVNSLVLKSLPVRSPQQLYLLSAQETASFAAAVQLRHVQIVAATCRPLKAYPASRTAVVNRSSASEPVTRWRTACSSPATISRRSL